MTPWAAMACTQVWSAVSRWILGVADEVGAGVTHVYDVDAVVRKDQGGAGGAHAGEVGALLGGLVDAVAGPFEGLVEDVGGGARRGVAVDAHDGVHGQAAGDAAALVAAHAVGHHHQVSLGRGRTLAPEVAVAVLVFLAAQADVTESGDQRHCSGRGHACNRLWSSSRSQPRAPNESGTRNPLPATNPGPSFP